MLKYFHGFGGNHEIHYHKNTLRNGGLQKGSSIQMIKDVLTKNLLSVSSQLESNYKQFFDTIAL